MNFDDFWNNSIKLLQEKITESDGKFIVKNWRVDKDNLPEEFPVTGANDDEIICLSIFASKKISIVKDDMEALYDMWADYINREVGRMDIIENVPRPTYCVAIMKVLMDNFS